MAEILSDPPDVLTSAWHAAGRPDPGVPLNAAGSCVRCTRQVDGGADLATVVSDNYADWERLPGYQAPGPLVWCPACAWGHRHAPLRTRPHLISPDSCRALDPADLFVQLAAPLAADRVVIVPRSRHKHLAPFAVWGTVATDDLALPWTDQDSWCLAVTGWLRGLGFSEAALRRPTPPIEPARWPQARLGRVLHRWDELAPWRQRTPWLEVGLRATRHLSPTARGQQDP
jgi:hypothetical protein